MNKINLIEKYMYNSDSQNNNLVSEILNVFKHNTILACYIIFITMENIDLALWDRENILMSIYTSVMRTVLGDKWDPKNDKRRVFSSEENKKSVQLINLSREISAAGITIYHEMNFDRVNMVLGNFRLGFCKTDLINNLTTKEIYSIIKSEDRKPFIDYYNLNREVI